MVPSGYGHARGDHLQKKKEEEKKKKKKKKERKKDEDGKENNELKVTDAWQGIPKHA